MINGKPYWDARLVIKSIMALRDRDSQFAGK